MPNTPQEEEWKLRENNQKHYLLYLCGSDNKELGYLKEENDQLTFHGKADEAAQVFFDAIIEKYDLRINELKQQRAATEERMREGQVRLLEKMKVAIFDKNAERHELSYDVEDLIDQTLREMKEEK
jgi:hypothetical protein